MDLPLRPFPCSMRHPSQARPNQVPDQCHGHAVRASARRQGARTTAGGPLPVRRGKACGRRWQRCRRVPLDIQPLRAVESTSSCALSAATAVPTTPRTCGRAALAGSDAIPSMLDKLRQRHLHLSQGRGLSVDSTRSICHRRCRDLLRYVGAKGPPEPCAQVRILPGAPSMRCPKTPSPAETLRAGSSRMCRRVRPGAGVCRGLWTRRGRDLGASPPTGTSSY